MLKELLIKTFFKRIDIFLLGGFSEENDGVFIVSKARMYSVAGILAIFTAIILGVVAFLQDAIFLTIADFSFAALVTLQIYFLRKTKDYNKIAILGASIVGVFYLYLLFSGGVNNTASLWLFTYPLVTFSLLDSKRGMLVNSVMFFSILIYFVLLQGRAEYFTEYSLDYIFRFIPVYLVVSIYSFLFSNGREKTFNLLENRNNELEKIVSELEIQKEKLRELSSELEKRVEERTIELSKARNDAEKSEKIKTEFLAQMSHEIRSPLNVILSFIELIKAEVEDKISEDMKYSFDSIESASSRIIRTIDLILNMTDLQVGSYEKRISEIDIPLMLTRIKSEYVQSASNKNLSLTLDINLTVEEIFSDEYALTQVISNLVDNSIKYTSKGFIKISAFEEGENWIVQVEDSGIGMSEEFLPNLFNSFTQEEQGYSRSYEGNGLGMALVKKYCDIIDAEISVESEKGKGSTFTLRIPNLKSK